MSFWEDTYDHSASQGWAHHRDILGSLLVPRGWHSGHLSDWTGLGERGPVFVRQRPGLRFARGLGFLRETRSLDQLIKSLDFPMLATISKKVKKKYRMDQIPVGQIRPIGSACTLWSR